MSSAIKLGEEMKRKEIKLEKRILVEIERAAALEGLDVTSFIRQASIHRANEVIEKRSKLILSNADFEAMMSDEDAEPNRALIDLMKD